MLDSTRLLFDLQQVNRLGQKIAGCLESGAIAGQITDALVDTFDCAFARIWLTDPDQQSLTLVASSGLYTHINGSFARVPMGAYKVGKIAQNHVPFLSNQLAEEPWVKDREWAIANQIRGFAGYPLMAGERVLGVLATFSHEPLASEFLEVLQVICLTATIALDAAIQHQRQSSAVDAVFNYSLSDQLVKILGFNSLMLVGTERKLAISIEHVVLRAVELLKQFQIHYCRLTYRHERLSLEAIVAMKDQSLEALTIVFQDIQVIAEGLGGTWVTQTGKQNQVLEIVLELPYERKDPVFSKPPLSEREHEVMSLLAQGYRDRDIAQQLHISESTVKFHMNNTLTKLKAKNRYQAVYEATSRSWI
ncbi:MAG: LuxR C-terminal-related transcriptional regulator [Cyanobacteria bacterium P01_F01_bin.3]